MKKQIRAALVIISYYLSLSAGIVAAGERTTFIPPAVPPPDQENCIRDTSGDNAWYCNGDTQFPTMPGARRSGREDPCADSDLRDAERDNCNNPEIVRQVGGISIDRLGEILEKNLEGLSHIPGFAGGGIDKDGIFFYVDSEYGNFPSAIGGAHVHLKPAQRFEIQGAGLTQTQRPIHGGIDLGFLNSLPDSAGVVNGVVLAHGQPWIIFPSHTLAGGDVCNTNPPYPLPIYSGNPLWQMPRATNPIDLVMQPVDGNFTTYPKGISYPRVGYVETFDTYTAHTASTNAGWDIGAAALDNNSTARDNSVGFQSVPGYTGSALSPEYDGLVARDAGNLSLTRRLKGVVGPYVNQYVYVFTADFAFTGQSVIPAQVDAVDIIIPQQGTGTPCASNPVFWSRRNIEYRTLGRQFNIGDSGSPVAEFPNGIDAPGYYVGQHQWGLVTSDPSTTRTYGGGMMYKGTAEALKLEDNGITLGAAEYRSNNPAPVSLATISSVTLDANSSPYNSWAGPTVLEPCFPYYIKNESSTDVAKGVAIELATPNPPVTFRYINPTGAVNTPYDIQPNMQALFSACLYSPSQVAPFNYVFNAFGINARSPIIKIARNTIMARWDTSPQSSFTTTATTKTNDDVVHVSKTGSTTFLVNAHNDGQPSTVNVTVETDLGDGTNLNGYATLDVCETSDNINCSTAAANPLLSTFALGQSKTFLVRVFGVGNTILLNYYYNRIFLRFYSGSTIPSNIRGSVGLALTTEPSWSGWAPMPGGGATLSGPGLTIYNGVPWAFVRGTDNRIYTNHLISGTYNSWVGWSEIPGGISTYSKLTATVYTNIFGGVSHEWLYLFIRGIDNKIYQNAIDSTNIWTGWGEVPGGGFTLSGPTSVAWTPPSNPTNFLYIWVRGTDNKIYQNHYALGSWSGWAEIGGAGQTTAGPASVILVNTLVLSVSSPGSGNFIFTQSCCAPGWSGWAEIPPGGGQTSDGPNLVVFQDLLYVTIQGTDNRIYTNSYDYRTGIWSGWGEIPPGGSFTSSGPGAASTATTLYVAMRDANNVIYLNRGLTP